jgi:hypothetical protein
MPMPPRPSSAMNSYSSAGPADAAEVSAAASAQRGQIPPVAAGSNGCEQRGQRVMWKAAEGTGQKVLLEKPGRLSCAVAQPSACRQCRSSASISLRMATVAATSVRMSSW